MPSLNLKLMPAITNRATRTDQRARLIKLIHVAKRELCMDETTYRAMLLASGGAQSTTQMDVPALERVLARLKHTGFKVRHKSAPAAAPGRALDTREQARKVRALWLLLHALGVVRDPSEAALAAYVKRIAGIDAMQWAGGAQLHQLIETLKKWAMRYLPEINSELRDDAIARARAGKLTIDQLATAREAEKLRNTRNTDTFDVQWSMWSCWQRALQYDVPAQLLADMPEVADEMPRQAAGGVSDAGPPNRPVAHFLASDAPDACPRADHAPQPLYKANAGQPERQP